MSHDKLGLWQLGITHVLNAAHGKLCCKGSDDFYGTTVKYLGVPANDLPTFDLSPFFYPAAEFIHQALTSGGKHMFSRGDTKTHTPCILSVFVSFMVSRKGVCALCCGCESLGCSGPSLPDDSPPPRSSVLCALCATEALDLPKQRLPATAHSSGPKAAGRRQSGGRPCVIKPRDCPPLLCRSQCPHLHHARLSPLVPFYCMYTDHLCPPPSPLLASPDVTSEATETLSFCSEQTNQCNPNIK